MREIKFRAWDGHKITEPYTDDDYRNLNNAIAGVSGALMQYTGHEDKNGIEIYEGDIMANDLNPKGFLVDSLFVAYEMWRAYESMSKSTDWEVIGNIYENPELITPPSKA